MTDEAQAKRYQRTGMIPGLILIAVGTVVLLDHMGVFPAHILWMYWPLALIVVGIVKFLREQSRVGGALLVVSGVLVQLHKLGYVQLSMADFWPLVLIGIGVALIWTRLELPKFPRPTGGGSTAVNEFALFGGVKRRVNINNFQGGSATAMFGGVELDFRSAEMEGDEAVLLVEAMFAGIEITVPDRWIVTCECQNIFGGYNDETRPPLPDVPGAATRKRLILRGRAVFGGIEVKN